MNDPAGGHLSIQLNGAMNELKPPPALRRSLASGRAPWWSGGGFC